MREVRLTKRRGLWTWPTEQLPERHV